MHPLLSFLGSQLASLPATTNQSDRPEAPEITRFFREPHGPIIELTGSIEGNRFVGRDGQNKQYTIDHTLLCESAEQAAQIPPPARAAPGSSSNALRRRGLRPSSVTVPLKRPATQSLDDDFSEDKSDKRIKFGLDARTPQARLKQSVVVQIAPDETAHVPVGKCLIDLTQPKPVEELELDWTQAEIWRGRMEHIEELDGVFFKRDFNDPTKVAAAWADPNDDTKVHPAITFGQPWFDPDYAAKLFTEFILLPEDAKICSKHAGRDGVRHALTMDALTDLVTTSKGAIAPSARNSYVDTVRSHHIGPGEEILVRTAQNGLFASADIGKGFQFLGMYAMVELTEEQAKDFLSQHGYTRQESVSYAMDMPVPKEGQTRPTLEQFLPHVARRKQSEKKPERPIITGTGFGGGNKTAFVNTATKDGTITHVKYRPGKAPLKKRVSVKVTDDDRINAFFLPMVIPYKKNGVLTLTVGNALVGYNLQPDGPVLADYGPDYVKEQLNAGKSKSVVMTAAEPEERGGVMGVKPINRDGPEDNDRMTVDTAPAPDITPMSITPVAPRVTEMREARPFVIPETMKLSPDIRMILNQMQAALNAIPFLSQKEKDAGPSIYDLGLRLSGTAFKHLTKANANSILRTLRRFDAYLWSAGQPSHVKLEDALVDLSTFEKHAQAAVAYDSKIIMADLYALRAVCFPDTPARREVEKFLETESALKTGKTVAADQKRREFYLNSGTNIDLHLAKSELHFADVCRVGDGPQHEAENQLRAARFIQMKDEMMEKNFNYDRLSNLLKALRLHLHPLSQDKDLAALIGNARYQIGDPVAARSKTNWMAFAPTLAEALWKGGLDVTAFINKVREGAVAGLTADQKLANFQALTQPFPDSTFNYAGIKDKIGSVSEFDEMLRHIIKTPCMADRAALAPPL